MQDSFWNERKAKWKLLAEGSDAVDSTTIEFFGFRDVVCGVVAHIYRKMDKLGKQRTQ